MTEGRVYLLRVAPIQLGDYALEKRNELLEGGNVGIDKFGFVPRGCLRPAQFKNLVQNLVIRPFGRYDFGGRRKRRKALFELRSHDLEDGREVFFAYWIIADDAVDSLQ